MYTDVKNVRVLISLLKKYNISDAVLSSGTCSIPVLQSLEVDSFFNCYSDIDERSAIYVAIGIAQMKQNPVVVVCTSGTAASNYLPGICEAKKLAVPLIVITCDKDPHTLGHMTIQKINQHEIFGNNCDFYATVPVIKDSLDEWAAKTYITQAIIKAVYDKTGPVHLNIYTDGDKKTFNTPDLPTVNKVKKYSYFELCRNRNSIIKELKNNRRILVVAGQQSVLEQADFRILESFCEKYGAVLLAEHVANIKSKYALNPYKYIEQVTPNEFSKSLKPDLLITFGGNFASYEIKTVLKDCHIKHWWIDPKGELVDLWRSIDSIFECNPTRFFSELIDNSINNMASLDYYNAWKTRIDEMIVDIDNFSSLYSVGEICKRLDGCKLIHLGILNSTRLVHLRDIPQCTRVYCNLGALGIDGSLSTFLGQVDALEEGYGLCILGDLSFFYDINSLYGHSIPNNLKIVLLNNGGGSEFHLNTGVDVIPTLDNYISAGHSSKAEKYIKSLGFDYFCASNKMELKESLDKFLLNQKGSFLEIFTEMETDALAIKSMYKANGYSVTKKQTAAGLKKFLTKTIGIKKTQKIVKMAKVWRDE